VTAWIDGQLVPLEEARVSVLDHGLVVGDGVFETMRVYNGVPFAWTRHLARLRASAQGLGLPLPDLDGLRAACDAVLAANSLREARLRVTVTGGAAPPGSPRSDEAPTLFIVASPIAPFPPTADVVIAPWTRNEHGALAGLKTISYAANVRALAYARERNASEAIIANTQGNLCEAAGSNVFCVIDGLCVTPPASAGCLLGVTRALLVELGEVVERDIPIADVARAQEAFLSSTTREVQAIAHVDGVALPAAPGPMTARLAAAFKELLARSVDP
jgi:branched-chain amino acid aminotransferase